MNENISTFILNMFHSVFTTFYIVFDIFHMYIIFDSIFIVLLHLKFTDLLDFTQFVHS